MGCLYWLIYCPQCGSYFPLLCMPDNFSFDAVDILGKIWHFRIPANILFNEIYSVGWKTSWCFGFVLWLVSGSRGLTWRLLFPLLRQSSLCILPLPSGIMSFSIWLVGTSTIFSSVWPLGWIVSLNPLGWFFCFGQFLHVNVYFQYSVGCSEALEFSVAFYLWYFLALWNLTHFGFSKLPVPSPQSRRAPRIHLVPSLSMLQLLKFYWGSEPWIVSALKILASLLSNPNVLKTILSSF